MSLPKVFFDMAADGEALGRITIEASEDATYYFCIFPSPTHPNAFTVGAF
jgi:hypothetical protein